MGQLGFVQVTHSAVVTGIASFIGCMQEKGLLKLLMNRIEFCIIELILTTKAQYLEHSSSVTFHLLLSVVVVLCFVD